MVLRQKLKKIVLTLFGIAAGVLVLYLLNRQMDVVGLAKAQADGVTIRIRDEGNLIKGHQSIGIDERSLKATGDIPLLKFSLLCQWRYDPKTNPPCPKKIKAHNGEMVRVVGFMYPLEMGQMVRSFCLLRTTQTCCYGPAPDYPNYILTEVKSPVPFERFRPVVVTGKFFVDPRPKEGYIYRLEAISVTPAEQERPSF